MARVKTDDPDIERSCELQDIMTTVRHETCEAMRLGKLIQELKKHPDEEEVFFDFCGLVPNGLDSYRGYYSDLAIGFSTRSEGVLSNVKLQETLREAIGKTFCGYKGGDYMMESDTPVWVANYGESHGTAVVAVSSDASGIIIHTAKID